MLTLLTERDLRIGELEPSLLAKAGIEWGVTVDEIAQVLTPEFFFDDNVEDPPPISWPYFAHKLYKLRS